MIAYVGNESDCSHGLAISLIDFQGGQKVWSKALSVCTYNDAVPGGTWRLPSVKDWKYMIIGCGSGESYDVSSPDYIGLMNKLTDVGGSFMMTFDSVHYWSSTVYHPGVTAYTVSFREGKAIFGNALLDAERNIRACLAF